PVRMRRRLLFVVVGAVATAVCALVVGFNVLLDRQLTRDADGVVRARATTELNVLRPVYGRLTVGEAPDEAAPDAYVWVFSQGRVLEAPRVGAETGRAARAAAAHPFRFTDAGTANVRLYALPAVFAGRRLGTVVAGTSLAPYEQSRRTALVGS